MKKIPSESCLDSNQLCLLLAETKQPLPPWVWILRWGFAGCLKRFVFLHGGLSIKDRIQWDWTKSTCSPSILLGFVCLLKSMTLPSWNYAGNTYQGSPSVLDEQTAKGSCRRLCWHWALAAPTCWGGRNSPVRKKQTTLNLRSTIKSGVPISSLPKFTAQALAETCRLLWNTAEHWAFIDPSQAQVQEYKVLLICLLVAGASPWKLQHGHDLFSSPTFISLLI